MAYQKVIISGINTSKLTVLKESEKKSNCCGRSSAPAARKHGTS